MPIKNYTSKVPASRSIDEIQKSVISHGAIGVLFEYEQGTGLIAALKFMLEIKGNKVGFSLPVDWRKFQAVLKKDQVKRWDDNEYCYRVAWRCLRDWVLAQMALYETQMVDLPQVFLPFATSQNGQTLYDQVINNGLLLGEGNSEK